MAAAALLYDMAALQPTERSQFGYKRAAKAIIGLPVLGRRARRRRHAARRAVRRSVQRAHRRRARRAGPVADRGCGGREATASRTGADAPRLPGGYLSHFAHAAGARRALDGDDRAARRATAATSRCTRPGATAARRSRRWRRPRWRSGTRCLGITDHSYGLPIARGMSMADVVAQHREIDALNERLAGRFRVFKGIEANILADGSLDLQPDERAVFEFVVASPHSLLRRDRGSDRADAGGGRAAGRGDPRAPARPGVQQPPGRRGRLGPRVRGGRQARRGRSSSTATGIGRTSTSSWRAVRSTPGASSRSTATRTAIGELRFSDYAIAHARLAGIPADRVINCWSNERARRVDGGAARGRRASRGSRAALAAGGHRPVVARRRAGGRPAVR